MHFLSEALPDCDLLTVFDPLPGCWLMASLMAKNWSLKANPPYLLLGKKVQKIQHDTTTPALSEQTLVALRAPTLDWIWPGALGMSNIILDQDASEQRDTAVSCALPYFCWPIFIHNAPDFEMIHTCKWLNFDSS